jgi:hypothetical protein
MCFNLRYFIVLYLNVYNNLNLRHSICFPNHIIPLLDEMFNDSAEDNMMQDSIPNLIFNDYDEWETVPNSNEIPSEDTFNVSNLTSINQAINPTSIRNVSTSLISSVLSQFWYKNQQAK